MIKRNIVSHIITVLVTALFFLISDHHYRHIPQINSLTLVFVSLISGTVIAFLFGRRIRKELTDCIHLIQTFNTNEFIPKNKISEIKEFRDLSSALMQMGKNTANQLENLTQQKLELNAVLESMVEGVIAINSEEKILNMNQAALEVLGLNQLPLKNPSVQEVIRNTEFQSIVRKILSSQHSIQENITLLQKNTEITLQVNAVPLRDSESKTIGALFVFHDITKLRKLESIRSDFVANVSHELKTPITSIRGFVETLLDGALDNPEDAKRFTEIINKQSKRLSNIIDDLLSLSRLEHGEESAQINLDINLIQDVILRAIQTCQKDARDKSIQLKIFCNDELTWNVNGHLLEQAFVNLITNAIKYSDNDSEIHISAKQMDNELLLTVQDFGAGISSSHLPRLFERFYRVDKARSRKLGGTGLGLAITKHIAQAHKGFIEVKSNPGKGSIFTIHIPVVARSYMEDSNSPQ